MRQRTPGAPPQRIMPISSITSAIISATAALTEKLPPSLVLTKPPTIAPISMPTSPNAPTSDDGSSLPSIMKARISMTPRYIIAETASPRITAPSLLPPPVPLALLLIKNAPLLPAGREK